MGISNLVNEKTIFATVVFISVAGLEYTTGIVTHPVAVVTSAFSTYKPNERGEGFVKDAQDHFFATAICISNNERELLQAKAFRTVALCRAWDKHSLFFGPNLSELVEQELPTVDQLGNGWYSMPGRSGKPPMTLPIFPYVR
jgi:hypothetical protein